MHSQWTKLVIDISIARDVPHGTSRSHISSVKFYYVYVLQSNTFPFWIYVGFTENLKKRLVEHNNGYTPSTKHYKPLRLIHYEAYANMKDAKRRELYLKTTKGKTTLKTMLKDYLFTNK